MTIKPLEQTDFYKVSHHAQYPDDTVKIYSNLTPRKSRIPGIKAVVVFAIQYFIIEYLIRQWNRNFFHLEMRQRVKDPNSQEWKACRAKVVGRQKLVLDSCLGKDSVKIVNLEKLWDLGYLPLEIKALPEGSLCPIGVPCATITNTVDHAYWLVNYLETIFSCSTWQGMTSATIAHQYRKIFNKYAKKTTGSTDFVQWQGHDFSMRGMSSLESACISGAGHLLSFTGTDTIPAISFLEQYYGADIEKELIGGSVPATEHSVMCMGGNEDELGTFSRLLNLYPKGILSVVSDTWDLTKVVKPAEDGLLWQLRDRIFARDGKLVLRPDSCPEGLTPVDIICGKLPGTTLSEREKQAYYPEFYNKGLIECLDDIFGHTINEQGYKVLISSGGIYGDSISLEIGEKMCARLEARGYASTNVVFGIGSYTYQMNTRDTFGLN